MIKIESPDGIEAELAIVKGAISMVIPGSGAVKFSAFLIPEIRAALLDLERAHSDAVEIK